MLSASLSLAFLYLALCCWGIEGLVSFLCFFGYASSYVLITEIEKLDIGTRERNQSEISIFCSRKNEKQNQNYNFRQANVTVEGQKIQDLRASKEEASCLASQYAHLLP